MTALAWLGFAVGIVLLVTTAASVLKALVVPRPPRRVSSGTVQAVIRAGFRLVALRLPGYEAKDRLLAAAEPMTLLLLLTWWVARFLLGYALVLWPLDPSGLGHALRESGSSMLTLGIVVPGHAASTAVDYLAAGTGLVIVALEIAYLPTIYGAFNRREVLVTMLASRAGVPAWGPELLARHQLVGILDDLPAFYGAWESWAAELAESHTSYPSLLWLRSPKALYSWVVGLLAVLDSAALYLALSPSRAPSQARLCLRMGFTALRDVAGVVGIAYDPDPDPEGTLELGFDEFLGAVERLARAGFPMERTPEDAWPHFRGWRVNYEPLAYALADLVMAPPAPWSGPRRHLPMAEIPPVRPVDRVPLGGSAAPPGAPTPPPAVPPGGGGG
ncbi:MAG: hypothetical protein ACRD0J_00735 [Acidimicrobiales bacterium]